VADWDEMREFVREMQERYPLPAKADWLACNEKSEYFWMQADG